jgi:hypothetical protein
MLAHLHEVLRASISEQVNPFLRIKDRRCEILDEVIVHHVRTVGVKMVLPRLVGRVGSLVEIPPIPLGV